MDWRSPGSPRPCQGSESQALAREGAPWLQALVSQQDNVSQRPLALRQAVWDGTTAICLFGMLGCVGIDEAN